MNWPSKPSKDYEVIKKHYPHYFEAFIGLFSNYSLQNHPDRIRKHFQRILPFTMKRKKPWFDICKRVKFSLVQEQDWTQLISQLPNIHIFGRFVFVFRLFLFQSGHSCKFRSKYCSFCIDSCLAFVEVDGMQPKRENSRLSHMKSESWSVSEL